MLKFSEEQCQQLEVREGKEFVRLVRDNILEEYPELKSDAQLLDRLETAYAHTQSLGFVQSDVIVKFLHTEAIAPKFYDQPPINAWLRKPGQTVEQRFSDLLSAMQAQLRQREK